MHDTNMKELTSKEYSNKVLGSWLGRVAGDFVGAPVEFVPYPTIIEKYGNIEYFPEPLVLPSNPKKLKRNDI
ncbi:unnamed protein product, partial [marine sediment metagenome]